MKLLAVHIHGGHLNGDIINYKSYTIYCDIQFTFHKVGIKTMVLLMQIFIQKTRGA